MWKFNYLFFLLFAGLMLSSCQGKSEADSDESVSGQQSEYLARIELAGRDSVSVLSLLQETHEVEYRTSAMGSFVTAIDSQPTGGGAYWVYRINDTTPQAACDRVLTKAGDRVTWYLRPQ